MSASFAPASSGHPPTSPNSSPLRAGRPRSTTRSRNERYACVTVPLSLLGVLVPPTPPSVGRFPVLVGYATPDRMEGTTGQGSIDTLHLRRAANDVGCKILLTEWTGTRWSLVAQTNIGTGSRIADDAATHSIPALED
jgi:hypothetical protein